MFEPKEESDSQAPLQAGDECGTIEQHSGSDSGTTGQQDDGALPGAPSPP